MRYFGLLVILIFCCQAKYIPEDGIYSVAEIMPQYQDGMSEFDSYIQSQLAPVENQSSGSVFISFVVNIDGNIEQIKVVRSLSEGQDLLALEAVKSAPGKWNPGMDEGKPVNVKLVYPINFN